MMDLKDRPELGWNVLFGTALVGIVVAVWFGFLSPAKPVPLTIERNLVDQRQAAERQAVALKADEKLIAGQTWNTSAETLGSTVLDYVSGLAEKHSVQLTNFRTDSPIQVASLSEAPFVLIVEGGFPDILAFTNALEDPKSKLAVNLMTISASDTGPGRVTATFGLLGFLFKEPK
jgi:hypothetical protein